MKLRFFVNKKMHKNAFARPWKDLERQCSRDNEEMHIITGLEQTKLQIAKVFS
jgi:hypothetical protein